MSRKSKRRSSSSGESSPWPEGDESDAIQLTDDIEDESEDSEDDGDEDDDDDDEEEEEGGWGPDYSQLSDHELDEEISHLDSQLDEVHRFDRSRLNEQSKEYWSQFEQQAALLSQSDRETLGSGRVGLRWLHLKVEVAFLLSGSGGSKFGDEIRADPRSKRYFWPGTRGLQALDQGATLTFLTPYSAQCAGYEPGYRRTSFVDPMVGFAMLLVYLLDSWFRAAPTFLLCSVYLAGLGLLFCDADPFQPGSRYWTGRFSTDPIFHRITLAHLPRWLLVVLPFALLGIAHWGYEFGGVSLWAAPIAIVYLIGLLVVWILRLLPLSELRANVAYAKRLSAYRGLSCRYLLNVAPHPKKHGDPPFFGWYRTLTKANRRSVLRTYQLFNAMYESPLAKLRRRQADKERYIEEALDAATAEYDRRNPPPPPPPDRIPVRLEGVSKKYGTENLTKVVGKMLKMPTDNGWGRQVQELELSPVGACGLNSPCVDG